MICKECNKDLENEGAVYINKEDYWLCVDCWSKRPFEGFITFPDAEEKAREEIERIKDGIY